MGRCAGGSRRCSRVVGYRQMCSSGWGVCCSGVCVCKKEAGGVGMMHNWCRAGAQHTEENHRGHANFDAGGL